MRPLRPTCRRWCRTKGHAAPALAVQQMASPRSPEAALASLASSLLSRAVGACLASNTPAVEHTVVLELQQCLERPGQLGMRGESPHLSSAFRLEYRRAARACLVGPAPLQCAMMAFLCRWSSASSSAAQRRLRALLARSGTRSWRATGCWCRAQVSDANLAAAAAGSCGFAATRVCHQLVAPGWSLSSVAMCRAVHV